ncbi:MAG: aminotransferase class I and II [Caldilineaceae bacterium]|nr:aminotransferase class I and II [Caldilineaceae bacterium]
MVRTVTAMRYVVPLREGGSLPAIVEADDGAMYVMKFVGSGQGAKALIAELIAGEIGRVLDLNVPEIVLMQMSPLLGRSEPDPEIRDLLRASAGLNLGLRYLPGAFAYNQLLQPPPPPELASAIVWFDAYVTNVDRTDRNVNLLLWEQRLWLIDHGAALYFHHDWAGYQERIQSPFTMVRHHTLLPYAGSLAAVDERLRQRLGTDTLQEIVSAVPAAWLQNEPYFADVTAHRAAYLEYLTGRRDASAQFVEEAIRARGLLV